jgi:hypothetical protein
VCSAARACSVNSAAAASSERIRAWRMSFLGGVVVDAFRF